LAVSICSGLIVFGCEIRIETGSHQSRHVYDQGEGSDRRDTWYGRKDGKVCSKLRIRFNDRCDFSFYCLHLTLNLLEPFRILALEQRNGKRLGADL